MKKIFNSFIIFFSVFVYFSCETKTQDYGSKETLDNSVFFTKIARPVSADEVKLMLALDNYRISNANGSNSPNEKDKAEFDYLDKVYRVNSVDLARIIEQIHNVDPQGHLLCLFGLKNAGFKNGKNVYSNFSLNFMGMDSKYNKIESSKVTPITLTLPNSKSTIADTTNYSRLVKELAKNKTFGFSKSGHNGVTFKVIDIKQYLGNYIHHPIYIYPSVNLDIDNMFTTLIFSNKSNLRENNVSFESRDVFGDKSGSCCPPQYY